MTITRIALLSAVLLCGHSAYAAETVQDKFPTGHWVSTWYLEQHSPDVEQFYPFAEVDFAACGESVCGRIVKEGKCADVSMILTRLASGTWSGKWKIPSQDEVLEEEYNVEIRVNSDKEIVWKSASYPSALKRSLGFSSELVHKGGNVCAPTA